MKKEKVVAIITHIERLNNSVYGNPSWRVWFSNESDLFAGRTAPNSSAGYTLSSWSIGRKYEITYHYTASGKLYVDYAKEI
jgi:hypothetical protein